MNNNHLSFLSSRGSGIPPRPKLFSSYSQVILKLFLVSWPVLAFCYFCSFFADPCPDVNFPDKISRPFSWQAASRPQNLFNLQNAFFDVSAANGWQSLSESRFWLWMCQNALSCSGIWILNEFRNDYFWIMLEVSTWSLGKNQQYVMHTKSADARILRKNVYSYRNTLIPSKICAKSIGAMKISELGVDSTNICISTF